MQLNLFPISLVDAYMLSPGVKHFVFKADKNPPFDFLPGQFITIHFDKNGKTLKRSYSIANAPVKDNLIEFAAGYVEKGPGTDLLFNLAIGESIQINGPFGRLILKDVLPKRYVFVATSTGVTPYRAMVPELKLKLQQQPGLKIMILFGVQNPVDAIYQEELIAFAAEHPAQITLRFQLSRTSPSDLQAYQYSGYVQHAFPEIGLNPLEDMVYLCGNPAMIDAAFEDLKNRGFTPHQVIREKYLSAP